MRQGVDVDPHPSDNHTQHIAKHTEFLVRMREPQEVDGVAKIGPSETEKSPGLAGIIQSHIDEHKQALAGKAFGQSSPGAGLQQGQQGQQSQPVNAGAQALQQTQQQSGFGQQSGDGASALSGLLNQGGLNLDG